MAGRRVNLSELANEPVLPEARVPAFAESSPRTARLHQVAANPLNTREIQSDGAKISSIAESMKLHGQLQPCAVVTREAFLKIFPEYAAAIGDAPYIQVTGGRRRAAAAMAGMSTLDIVLKDNLAESRPVFISATAAENIDREDYDPIEEARAVQLLVQECGSGKAAAEQLSRTPPWVTQRLNLLKLAPEVQMLLRSGEMPLREARDLHKLPPEQQLAAWQERRRAAELTAVNRDDDPDDGDQKGLEPDSANTGETRQRLSPVTSAIRRLGGTPQKIAVSLRSELSPEELRALAELLLQEA